MTDTAATTGPRPFLVRVARGSIVDVHASIIAVSHVNDVAPSGAEKAVDDILGGAISRRADALGGRFGATHFLPTLTSPLAAGCVLIVSLGDAESFRVERLSEIGAALVDAGAAIGARDVATVVHAAGAAGIAPRVAACKLLTGVLEAYDRVEGAHGLRELTIAEADPERVREIVSGLHDAAGSARVHVYVEELTVRRRMTPGADTDASTPPHLRLGVTRAGPDLKVTRIGDGAFDRVCVQEFPAEIAEHLPASLHAQVLTEEKPEARAEALRSIGTQLYRAFLGAAELDAAALLQGAPDGLVVLRLDGWTVDLPWELMHTGEGFVALERRLGRQLEIAGAGRQSAFVPTHDGLRVLVVGNPTGDLDGAEREARAVARLLKKRAGAEVRTLIGPTRYEDVSRELDAHSFDVLHYAGHATFVEGRPDASGLRLADHLLTPEDLATRRYLPRLVVVNACHSAATGSPYDGNQETRTLVAGLLGAGVRAFLGAMWQVDDRAAGTFAAAFYDAIAPHEGPPKPVGEAVRHARQAVVDEHGESEHSWAAYALYGSPWQFALP